MAVKDMRRHGNAQSGMAGAQKGIVDKGTGKEKDIHGKCDSVFEM